MSDIDDLDDIGDPGDLDEPTKPFTHSQIGRMLNAAKAAEPPPERRVNLDRFKHFGEAGTPERMTGSRHIALVSGWCGDPPRPGSGGESSGGSLQRRGVADSADPYPWGPAPTELSGDDLPIPGALAPAGPVPAQTPSPQVAPVQAAARNAGEELEQDLVGAGLRKAGWVFVVIALLLAVISGVMVWWQIRPNDTPPPPPPPPPEIITAVPIEPEFPEATDGGELADPTDNPKAVKAGVVLTDGPEVEFELAPHKTPHCKDRRARAQGAKATGKWKRLDDLARETECWKPARNAKILRMNALFELGRLKECKRVGKGGQHPKIKKWMNLCSRGGD